MTTARRTMKTGSFIALIAALVATTGNAATVVFDEPLPYATYDGTTEAGCGGAPMSGGTINSVTAMGDGKFCENSFEDVEVFTRIDYSSCDTVGSGTVVLDIYQCTEAACRECDTDNAIFGVELEAPTVEPLPAADWCFSVEGNGVSILNRFDASADAYWRFYIENSCLKDISSMTDAPSFVFSSEDLPSSAGIPVNPSKAGFVEFLAVFLTNLLAYNG